MSLSDAALGHGEPEGDEGDGEEIELPKIDPKHCAAEILKAVKNNDVNALENALRMFYVAVDDDDDEGDDGGGY